LCNPERQIANENTKGIVAAVRAVYTPLNTTLAEVKLKELPGPIPAESTPVHTGFLSPTELYSCTLQGAYIGLVLKVLCFQDSALLSEVPSKPPVLVKEIQPRRNEELRN